MHLLGSWLAATFVRLRLIVGLRFLARSLSFSSVNVWDSEGLPVCQRLREKPVPGGEAFAPQSLSASQAPAGGEVEEKQ